MRTRRDRPASRCGRCATSRQIQFQVRSRERSVVVRARVEGVRGARDAEDRPPGVAARSTESAVLKGGRTEGHLELHRGARTREGGAAQEPAVHGDVATRDGGPAGATAPESARPSTGTPVPVNSSAMAGTDVVTRIHLRECTAAGVLVAGTGASSPHGGCRVHQIAVDIDRTAESHSMRNTCSEPMNCGPSATSTTAPPPFWVRPAAGPSPRSYRTSPRFARPASVTANRALERRATERAGGLHRTPRSAAVAVRSHDPSTDAAPRDDAAPPVQLPLTHRRQTRTLELHTTNGARITSPPAIRHIRRRPRHPHKIRHRSILACDGHGCSGHERPCLIRAQGVA